MLRPVNPIQVFSPYWFDVAGKRVKSADPGSLYSLVRLLDDQINGYEQWYPVMIHRMCLELPKNACRGENTDAYVSPLRWKDIIGFVTAVIAVVRSGLSGESIYVDQREADRRVFICNNCPMNKHVSCAGCVGIVSLAERFLRGRYAKGQANLGACKICKCWLPAKIWCSAEVLSRTVKHETYPDNCWNKDL